VLGGSGVRSRQQRLALPRHEPGRARALAGRSWFERFHWARFHFALFGPLALAATIAYEQIGTAGLAAFTLPPALMILSVRQYLERTAASVEEIREANLSLRKPSRADLLVRDRRARASGPKSAKWKRAQWKRSNQIVRQGTCSARLMARQSKPLLTTAYSRSRQHGRQKSPAA